jgi:prepilin-type N-terminal cleavage/methylation domain-containing protein/prepilin-type processing-associated H-X9-DG protein
MEWFMVNTLRPRVSTRRAFTLVELLVVIGILVVLIALLLPSIGRAREQTRRTACASNQRTLGQALFMYANTYKDRLPNGNPKFVWVDYLGANQVMIAFNDLFVKEPRVYLCPSDMDSPQPDTIVSADELQPNSARISYDFYSLYFPPEAGPFLTKLKGRAPLAWDLDGGPRDPAAPRGNGLQNHGATGGNVLFADGHVGWAWSPAEWESENWPKPATAFYPIATPTPPYFMLP